MPKRCQHCKAIKSLVDFNKCRTTDDGYHAQCKICRHNYYLAHAKEIYKKTRQYAFKWNQTKNGKISHRKGSAKFRRLHPEYQKAHNAVRDAIKAGKLKMPTNFKCTYCPEQAQQYHHYFDYAKEHWLDIQPICRKCHRKLHKTT